MAKSSQSALWRRLVDCLACSYNTSRGYAPWSQCFCVPADDHVVLISNDGERWGWPGGRPEGNESWKQTLRREVLEETCAVVRDARLLGFCRGVCLTGPEKGVVLVRFRVACRSRVDALGPRFEIAHRRSFPRLICCPHLWMEVGLEPIYHRR